MRRFRRSAAVLIAVVVVLTVSLALFGVWARAAVEQHRRMRHEQLRLQAVRLAEAGVRRGMAQRAADSAYTKELWRVPAGDLNTSRAGEVAIRVTHSDDPPATRFEATAEFPAGAVHHAQITRRIEMPNSVTGGEP
jgi:type II secretory pathway component PulK